MRDDEENVVMINSALNNPFMIPVMPRSISTAKYRSVVDISQLHLAAMKNEIEAHTKPYPHARSAFELAVTNHEKPRLWIDHLTNIEHEPKTRTYRLVQEHKTGWQTLHQTHDETDMRYAAVRYMWQCLEQQRSTKPASQILNMLGSPLGRLLTKSYVGVLAAAALAFLLRYFGIV
jgi:hypothetical protein